MSRSVSMYKARKNYYALYPSDVSQELMFRAGFKPYGFYITFVQFIYYSILSKIQLNLTKAKRSRYTNAQRLVFAKSSPSRVVWV